MNVSIDHNQIQMSGQVLLSEAFSLSRRHEKEFFVCFFFYHDIYFYVSFLEFINQRKRKEDKLIWTQDTSSHANI